MEATTSYGGLASVPHSTHRIVPASRIAPPVAVGSVIPLRTYDLRQISLTFVRDKAESPDTHSTGWNSLLTGKPVFTSPNTAGGGEGVSKTANLERRMSARSRGLVVFHGLCRAAHVGVWNGHSYEDVAGRTMRSATGSVQRSPTQTAEPTICNQPSTEAMPSPVLSLLWLMMKGGGCLDLELMYDRPERGLSISLPDTFPEDGGGLRRMMTTRSWLVEHAERVANWDSL